MPSFGDRFDERVERRGFRRVSYFDVLPLNRRQLLEFNVGFRSGVHVDQETTFRAAFAGGTSLQAARVVDARVLTQDRALMDVPQRPVIVAGSPECFELGRRVALVRGRPGRVDDLGVEHGDFGYPPLGGRKARRKVPRFRCRLMTGRCNHAQNLAGAGLSAASLDLDAHRRLVSSDGHIIGPRQFEGA